MTYIKDFTTTYTVNDHKYTVTAPAFFDDDTNEILQDDELDDKAAEIARQMYRKDMGFFSPEELRNYRMKKGLSQQRLAELTGLSVNTIALYEAGAFPTEANNKLLLSFMLNNQTLWTNNKMYSTNTPKKLPLIARAFLT